MSPYVPDTPMSELGKALPSMVHGKKYEVRIFTPKYSCINERRNQLHEVIRLSGLNLMIDDNDHPLIIKVATLLPSRMQVYFIDNDDYFHPMAEKGLETDILAADNDKRMMFFTMGVIETVKKLRWQPAIINCLGWISSLTPFYLRSSYADDPTFRSTKIVYFLCPEGFAQPLDARFQEKLKLNGFTDEQISGLGTEPVTCETLVKFAIDNADAIVEAAEGVAPELLEYAKASGKPFLSLTDGAGKDELFEFYNTLLDEEDE